MRIELHIDQLVLHGFSPHDRYRIGDAVQAELKNLIGANGLKNISAATNEIHRIDAGAFTIAREARPATIGGQVAQAVFSGLQRGPERFTVPSTKIHNGR